MPQITTLTIRDSWATPVYTGPGDVAGWSAAYEYVGLRAFSAAKAAASQPLFELASDANFTLNVTTFNSQANGYPDPVALAAYFTAYGFTRNGDNCIYLRRLYGQVNGIDLLPNASGMLLAQNKLPNSKPCIRGDGSSYFLTAASNGPGRGPFSSAPLSIAVLTMDRASGVLLGDGNWNATMSTSTTAVRLEPGNGYMEVATTPQDGAWHSFKGVLFGATSKLKVDGVAVSNQSTNGTDSLTANRLTLGAGTYTGGAAADADYYECLWLNGAADDTMLANMETNQMALTV